MPKVEDYNSILNPFGSGNVTGDLGLLPRLTPSRYLAADETRRTPTTDSIRMAPNAAVTRALSRGGRRCGENVARALLAEFGPFNAENSQANRDKIISVLLWLGDVGLPYDDSRVGGETSTYTPNETFQKRGGVCRDIHTALAAVLSSLAHAQKVNGEWMLGEPSNDGVAIHGFGTGHENHAFLTYRDVDGTWNALEYGEHYAIHAETQLGAFAALPYDVNAARFYQLRGWDGKPIVADQTQVDGAKVRDFFRRDLGNGKAGETRFSLDENGLQGALFLEDGLAMDARINFGVGLTGNDNGSFGGGLRVTYHRDISGDLRGYVHAAGGVLFDAFELSSTGLRLAKDRDTQFRAIIGLQTNGRLEDTPEIAGKHLRLSVGGAWEIFAPVSFTKDFEGIAEGFLGSVLDLKLNVGLEGEETLAKGLTLTWGVRYEHDIDFLLLGENMFGSGVDGLAPVLGLERGQLGYATRLSYEGKDVRAGLELGGESRFGAPIANELRGEHALRVNGHLGVGDVTIGVNARGQIDAVHGSPLDVVDVGVSYEPSDRVRLGVVASIPTDSRLEPRFDINANIKF